MVRSSVLANEQTVGFLRAGTFYAAVARAVLDHEIDARLQAWPKDRRKIAPADAKIRQPKLA